MIERPEIKQVAGAQCAEEGCTKLAKSRGYCDAHYSRLRKSGALKLLKKPTLEERFWSLVDCRGPDECWPWLGKLSAGYGHISINNANRPAHRVAYELTYEAIPRELDADHKCRNRACVNPDHIQPATRSMNRQNLSGATKISQTGIRGVYWVPRTNRYRAYPKFNGKTYHLGYFLDKNEAEKVVSAWRRENMPNSLIDRAT